MRAVPAIEWELLRNNHFHTREQVRHAVATWIENYNSGRRHSINNMLSPIAYEHACAQQRSAGHGGDPRAA